MSKHGKLLNHLTTGNTVTAKQITSRFGIKSPHRAIAYLREQGYCIYSNKTTLADGTATTKYRIGAPTKRMIKAINAVFGSAPFTR